MSPTHKGAFLVAGTAVEVGSPGDEVAVGPGTALEDRLVEPLPANILTEVSVGS